MPDDFPRDPVPSPEIQTLLEALSRKLADGMPAEWGFTVLIFEIDQPAPSVFYVSSASRDGNRVMLQEFLQRLAAAERSQ